MHESFIIPIVGMMIPIIIVPTALWFKHARFVRQAKHDERMRAMELGQTLTEDRGWRPMNVALTIGGGVPLGAMLIAFIAAPQDGGADVIWKAAATIGVAGVVCGSVLAGQIMTKQGQVGANQGFQKPAFDPEAFETVSHHG